MSKGSFFLSFLPDRNGSVVDPVETRQQADTKGVKKGMVGLRRIMLNSQ
jgi:hypothetical protein